jgi:alpha/beta superfamily hydrolase
MYIDGPAGVLECRFDKSDTPKSISAVLCHPHPQYGGSMSDAVLETAANVLLENGVNCLRFNFRGVGNSSGDYDNGVGEIQDLLAASNWLTQEYPQDNLWWLGYSFGSAVTWQGLQASEAQPFNPQRIILIAPPVGVMDFSMAESYPIEIHEHLDVFAGDRDNFVDAAKLENWEAVTPHIIPGADHFFTNQHELLAVAITEVLTA